MTTQDPKNQDTTIIDELENIVEQAIDDTDNIGKDVPVADSSEQIITSQISGRLPESPDASRTRQGRYGIFSLY